MILDEQSCGAIIFYNDRNTRLYLLLHYASGHWDFVKGHVEPGETEEETIRREAHEETGINDLVFIDGFRHEISYFYTYQGKRMRKSVIFYLAQTHTKHVRLSHEHQGFLWLPYDEAGRRVTFANAKQLINHAHKRLETK